MTSARQAYRSQIEGFAKQAFADHAIDHTWKDEAGKPYAWKVRNADPKEWSHWYMIAELPGAIVQYGDVGGLVIEAGRGYDLDWLSGAIESLAYVLEKSKARRDYFVEEMFKEYLLESGHDVSDYQTYADFVSDTGDTEAYERCHDWPADTLWAYWALRRFIELRRAETIRAATCPTT